MTESIQSLEHQQYILSTITDWPPLSAAQPTHRAGSLLLRGDNVWDGVRYVKAPDVTLRGAVPLEFDRGDYEMVRQVR